MADLSARRIGSGAATGGSRPRFRRSKPGIVMCGQEFAGKGRRRTLCFAELLRLLSRRIALWRARGFGLVVTAAGEMRIRNGVFGNGRGMGCFGSSSAKARVQWEAERCLSIAGGRPGGLFCRREHRSFGRYFVLSVIYSVIFFVSLYQDRDSFRFCKSNESRFRACYFLNPNEEKEKSAMKVGRDGFCRGSR